MTSPFTLNAPQPYTPLTAAAPEPLRSNADDIKWLSMFGLFRRRWLLVFAVMMLTALAALPFILSIEKTYYGAARIMFTQTRTIDLAAVDGEAQAPGFDILEELEMLYSRDMATAVIDRFGLHELPEFNPELKPETTLEMAANLMQALLLPGDEVLEEEPTPEEIADQIYQNYIEALGVMRQGLTTVVTVGFTSEDRQLAAAIPNAIAEIHLERTARQWRDEVAEATSWLDSKIEADNRRLDRIRERLTELRETTGLSAESAAEDTRLRLTALEARLTDISRQRLELRDAVASVATLEENPNVTVLAEPTAVTQLRAELQNERRALEALSATFGKNYDGVARLQANIEGIREELAVELKGYRYSLQARDAVLAARVNDLEQESAKLRAALEEQRLALPDLSRLSKVLFDQALAVSELELRRDSLRAEGEVPPVRIDVLAPAAVPIYPEGRSGKALLAAALFAGLLLGLTAAALVELKDRSVRSHEQLLHLDQLVPVGFLPGIRRNERRKLAEDIRSRAMTPAAEALRDTVFIMECAENGIFPSSVLVLGAEDGPTPVAELLAMELAASGWQVLMIEAGSDENVNSAFEQPLNHDVPLYRRIVQDAEAGVARLALGDNFLRDERSLKAFDELLFRATADGYVVIVSGPPALDGTALRLAQRVQRTLFVMRWGRTPRSEADLFVGLLSKARVEKMFSLIVDVDVRKHRRYGFNDRMSLPGRKERRRA